ncbi:hypothetical protein AALP_AA8G107600 [Arabis alpina]|uniref:RRM domain-containing protein n=1 Tax=Arabis alpina TaxID=50452 RepID=A0A087G686_ARAAL|nr:hypothetical protein AALP_AA8G107600 [Arabis alpina]
MNKSLIHISGQGIAKKAMELNGSVIGGWKVFVELSKMIPEYGYKPTTPIPAGVIDVTGSDLSLSEDDIERALIKHFSSCGKILEVILLEWQKLGLLSREKAE